MRDRAERSGQIPIHGAVAFEGMRRAGRLAAETLDMIGAHVRPGVTTDELNRICHEFILDHGATPAPLGYRGYPKATCISLNEVVCHGIPSATRLARRDILNIDVTVILDGWYGDSSRMYFADEPVTQRVKLCQTTFEALWKGIEAVRPGATLGDLGHAIQSFVEAQRLFGRARLLRPWHRPRVPRCAEHSALRQAGHRRRARAGHAVHDRADGQYRHL